MGVSRGVERRVRLRAGDRCEYCQLPQGCYALPFQIDHVIARQHGGRTLLNNLALACPRCNRNKGPNLAGIDREDRARTPLYHPRRDRWADHFSLLGPRLRGTTAVGRVTIHVLRMNDPAALELRRELIAEGIFLPGS